MQLRNQLISLMSAATFLGLAFGSADEKQGASSGQSSASPPGQPATPPSAKAEAAPPNGVPVGTSAVVNDMETTVQKAQFQTSVKKDYSSYKASEGAKLVIIDYSVKNVGREAVSCLDFASSVTDSKGVSYENTLDCNMAVDNWTVMDKVNPGLSKKFQACFEVPQDASGFTLNATCMFKEGKFNLGI